MYANEQIEKMNRAEIENLQLEKLKKTVAWAYEKSSYYKKSFDAANLKPEDIQNLSDVKKIPFLTLEEMNRTDPQDFLTLPLSSIVRICQVEENGEEVTKFYTKGDVQQNVEFMTRCLISSGISRASTVGLQGDLSDGKFLDILYALESIGATVIPLGADYRRWLKVLEKFTLDTLISTPQLIMQLIIQLQATWKNIIHYSIQKIICINLNNIQNPLQQHIEARAGTLVYNLFAPAEIGFAGMLFQCNNESGHHIQEDGFLTEIVKFNSDEVIEEDDVMGELVITTLTSQAMPLIRYRTGQAVRKMSEICHCGRTFSRIATPYTRSENEEGFE